MGLQAGIGGPASPLAEARAAPKSSLTIGFLQLIDSLNPYIGINDPSYLLYGLIYDYPFSFDEHGTPVPNIITSMSHDQYAFNWTYTVRQNVYWHDGSELTAADVAFTWDYDSQNLGYLWAYEPYFNQVIQCPGGKPKVGCGAFQTGPWQVTVYFQRPFAAGYDLFGPIVQKAQWQNVTPQCAGGTSTCASSPYENQNPIGTGPFVADPQIYQQFLTEQSPGGYIHLTRNQRYHAVGSNITGSDNIHIQDIYLKMYSDSSSLATALLGGVIDLAQFTPSTIDAAQNQPNILVQSGLQVIQEWNEIGISQIDTTASDKLLNPTRFDVNVRQAMAKATNKDYILQHFYNGQGVRGDTLLSPVGPWWYDPVKGGVNLTFNIQAANQQLNQSGYTTWSGGSFGKGTRQAANNIQVSYQTACYAGAPSCSPLSLSNKSLTIGAGTPLQFTLATRPQSDFPEEYDTAQYLQQQYAKIGVTLVLKPETTETALSGEVYNGTVEMYIWYWSSDPDPNYMLSMESSWTLDGWNDNYWNNATYNQYYIKQMGDLDPAQRLQDVYTAQRLNYVMAPYIIYVYPFGEWAMRTDLWQGWGNWDTDPFMQMNAYWGANPLFFNLTCPTCQPPTNNQPPTPPIMNIHGSASWYTNKTLTITATSSDPEPGDTLNYTWTWGDGTSSYCPANTVNANCSTTVDSSTASHSWNRTGVFQVSVSVSDGYTGVPTQESLTLNVTEAPVIRGWLAGVVRDTSNNPLAGATVITQPGGATSSSTGADGAYNITLAPGTYSATADARFYTNATHTGLQVTENHTTTQDFALVPNKGWITGTVTNSATNTPISGAAVYAIATTGAQTANSTKTQGVYNISVEAGTYTVNVSANGYVSASKQATVQPGRATTVSFALTPLTPPETLFTPLVIGTIAAVVIIAAIALAVVYLTRRRRKKEEEESKIELPPKT